MRKLSITLLLIVITFMSIGANELSTSKCKAIIFKRWHEKKKILIPIPIEATIDNASLQILFLQDVDKQVSLLVKGQDGRVILQDIVIPKEQESYTINLDGIAVGQYELHYIEDELTLIGEFEIEH